MQLSVVITAAVSVLCLLAVTKHLRNPLSKATARIKVLEAALADKTERYDNLFSAIGEDASQINGLKAELETMRNDREHWREIARQQAGKLIDAHHFIENFTAAPLLSWVTGVALWKYGREVSRESVYCAINSLAGAGHMTPTQYEFLRGSLNEPLYVPSRLSMNEVEHNDLLDAIARQSVANMPIAP